MKNILKSIIALAALAMCVISCEDEKGPFWGDVKTNPAITVTFSEALIIDKDNLESGELSVTFNTVEYDNAVAIMSELQIARAGSNFTPAVSLGAAVDGNGAQTVIISYRTLNAALTALETEPNEPANLQIRVRSFGKADLAGNTGEVSPVFSAPVSVTITPFEPQPGWVFAVGVFQGWNRTGNYGVVSLLDNGVYVTYINFPEANSTFLILPDNEDDWSHKWGSDDGETLIVDGGADIRSSGEGWYRITADLNDLSISMEQFGNLGVVGTINGWGNDGPDVPMTYNPQNHRFEATITCLDSDMVKFRLNEDWGTNWGGVDGVATSGGADLSIAEAGTYLITLDLTNPNNLVYTIEKQ